MDYKQFEGHSKAPLFAVEYAGFVNIQKTDYYEPHVNVLDSDVVGRERALANGKLFAAAPSLLARCQELEREVAQLRAFANTIADRFNETRRSSVFVLVRDSPTWNAIEQYTALKNDKV